MNSEQLIAEQHTSDSSHETHTQLPVSQSVQEHSAISMQEHSTATLHTEIHGDENEGAEGKVEAKDVFNHLFKELGDHHEFQFGPFHANLPLIFLDDNFYFYPSVKAMKESGVFTTHEGHPVRKADGKPPQWDFSVTNLVFFEWIAMFLIIVVAKTVAGRYKKHPKKAPRGIQNTLEFLITVVRDNIVYPNLGAKLGAKMLPYFLTTFFFVLVMNVVGLIPGSHAATGNIAVTAGLALTAFIVINLTAMRQAGVWHWIKHLTGNVHWAMWPIMVPVEVIGLFAKPFALAVRLFANMLAGHVVLLSLVGLIFFFQTSWVALVSVPFSIFIYLLELLVVFLQAFIFTMLTAVFTGLAIGSHAHDEAH